MTNINAKKVTGQASLGDSASIKFGDYNSVYYYSNRTNCKLCTLEGLPSLFDNSGANKTKHLNLLKEILKKTNYVMFFTHVITKEYVKQISKEYQLVYCQQVPIGYGSGMQYHCGFLIVTDASNNYLRRINDSSKENEVVLKKVEDKFIINEFLKKASNIEIEKLRSYVQPKRITDLVREITNRER